MSRQIAELTALVHKLQAEVDELRQKVIPTPSTAPAPSAAVAKQAAGQETAANPRQQKAIDVLHRTTVNTLFDGYYGYNFNNPIGRVNLLRAYDVSSNTFALSQADLVLENAADPVRRAEKVTNKP